MNWEINHVAERQRTFEDDSQRRRDHLYLAASVAAGLKEDIQTMPLVTLSGCSQHVLRTNVHDMHSIVQELKAQLSVSVVAEIVWQYARDWYIDGINGQTHVTEIEFLRLMAFEQASRLEDNICQFSNEGRLPMVSTHEERPYGYFVNLESALKLVGYDAMKHARRLRGAVDSADDGLLVNCCVVRTARRVSANKIRETKTRMDHVLWKRAKPLDQYPTVRVFYQVNSEASFELWDVYAFVDGDDQFLCNLYS